MPIKFEPTYTITLKMASCLMRIEAAKEKITYLPLTPRVLASLRETARLYTTHYSTMIEGNRLNPDQVEQIIKHEGHFPGRQREENEIKGYYAALNQVEQWATKKEPIHEKLIQTIHALVMSNGKKKSKPTPYRDGQNVICDTRTQQIVYMPPEAKDVPGLMDGLIHWISKSSCHYPLSIRDNSPLLRWKRKDSKITHYPDFASRRLRSKRSLLTRRILRHQPKPILRSHQYRPLAQLLPRKSRIRYHKMG